MKTIKINTLLIYLKKTANVTDKVIDLNKKEITQHRN